MSYSITRTNISDDGVDVQQDDEPLKEGQVYHSFLRLGGDTESFSYGAITCRHVIIYGLNYDYYYRGVSSDYVLDVFQHHHSGTDDNENLAELLNYVEANYANYKIVIIAPIPIDDEIFNEDMDEDMDEDMGEEDMDEYNISEFNCHPELEEVVDNDNVKLDFFINDRNYTISNVDYLYIDQFTEEELATIHSCEFKHYNGPDESYSFDINDYIEPQNPPINNTIDYYRCFTRNNAISCSVAINDDNNVSIIIEKD